MSLPLNAPCGLVGPPPRGRPIEGATVLRSGWNGGSNHAGRRANRIGFARARIPSFQFKNVRGNKTLIFFLGVGWKRCPTGYFATTKIRPAHAQPREIVDPIVPHGVVKTNLVADVYVAHGDEIMPAGFVNHDAAVWIARVIHHTDRTSVESKLMLSDLGRMAVIFGESFFNNANHYGVGPLELFGGEDPFPFSWGRSQLKSVSQFQIPSM